MTKASTDPERVAVSYLDGTVVVLGPDGEATFVDIEDDVADVAVVPATKTTPWQLAVAVPDAVVVFAPDRERPSAGRRLQGHVGRPTKVTCVTDHAETFLVSADERGNVHRWMGRDRDDCTVTLSHRKSVHQLISTGTFAGAPVFLTASDDRSVLIHPLRSSEVVQRLDGHAGWVDQAMPVDVEGALRFVATTDRIGLAVWDAWTAQVIGRQVVHAVTDLAVRVGDAEPRIALGSDDGHAMVWGRDAVRSVDVSADGSIRAAAFVSKDGPGVGVAVDNSLLLFDNGLAAKVGRVDLRSPVLRWRQWDSRPGGIIVLEDGSIVAVDL